MGSGLTDGAALLEQLDRDGIEHLWVAYHDYSARACAKLMPKETFRSTIRDGVVFAVANLDMTSSDLQAHDAKWLADSGDFMAVPDPRSYAVLPRFPKTARVHAWMRATDGSPWDGCPRTRLQLIVDDLKEEGFTAQTALEPEFYLLTRDERGEYQPINNTRMFTMRGLSEEYAFNSQVIDELRKMGVTVAQIGKEYGPGQYEMSVHHSDPIGSVDDYFSLKEAVRDIAKRLGYIATFMPKPYAHFAGCSLHAHLSLWDLAGKIDLTASDTDQISLSEVGGYFLGGILKHVDALTGLGSPTVNSYKRLLPGSWAPANTYWGYGNRSGVVRIPGVGQRRHLEFRSPDNSCQPYLLMAGLIAAGLDGIRNKMEPPEPFAGDVGHLSPEEMERYKIGFLPRTLPEALAALESDKVIGDAIGSTILEHFLIVKRQELAQYSVEVHPWERAMYLEQV